MTRPARRNNKAQISLALRLNMWVLFLAMILVFVIDLLIFDSIGSFLWTKSFTLGAILSFLGQLVFAWFAFRYTGAQARKHIVNQLYLGEVCKWIISLMGFSLIFITIRPIQAFAVFIGFIVMQISYSILLWKSN